MKIPRLQSAPLSLPVLLLLLCAGCEDDAPEPVTQAAPDRPSAPSPAADAGAAQKAAAAPRTPTAEHMRAHYGAATTARDAIITGDLEAAKAPLTWLASHEYPPSLPEDYRPQAAGMQAAAREGARAADLEAAARAVGQVAVACGDCHRTMNRVPEQAPSGFSELDDEDLKTRMHRHGWAMERMWEGLVGPWDTAWRIGAQVMAEGKLALEHDAKGGKLAEGLGAVRALGRQAASLEHGSKERALAYGDLIATCAGCHVAQGVKFGEQAEAAEAAAKAPAEPTVADSPGTGAAAAKPAPAKPVPPAAAAPR